MAIATFFEFICIFLYAYVFVKLPVVKYLRNKAASEGSKTVTSDLAAAGIHINAAETVRDSLLKSKIHMDDNVEVVVMFN